MANKVPSRASNLTWAIRILVICAILTIITFLWNSEFISELLVISNAILKENVNERCKQWNSTSYICLPNVLLIGASKCGTTSVFQYLIRHPRVSNTRRRVIYNGHDNEIHKFDYSWYPYIPKSVGLAYEIASSPQVTTLDHSIIHYTPQYIYAPSVPYSVRKFYPNKNDLKFIVLLRDPVQRAFSSYWFKNSELFNDKDRGGVNDFLRTFHAEKKLRKEYELCISESDYVPYSPEKILSKDVRLNNFNILKQCFKNKFRSASLGLRHFDKSIYVDQLDRWYQNFHPSQFYIVSYEEWIVNPLKSYENMLTFLNQKLFDEKAQDQHQHQHHHHYIHQQEQLQESQKAQTFQIATMKKKTKDSNVEQSTHDRSGFYSLDELEFLNKNYLSTNNTRKKYFPDSIIHELECYYRPYNIRLNQMIGREIIKIKSNISCEKYSFTHENNNSTERKH